MPRTDVASRVIAAPPAQVYAALVDRTALEVWLPPDGMTARFERFDPRPGGSYRLVLTYADGSLAAGKTTAGADVVDARYVDWFLTCGSFRRWCSFPTTLPSPAP
jgi:uncharacterized protein YndB with AHSA1/START domain